METPMKVPLHKDFQTDMVPRAVYVGKKAGGLFSVMKDRLFISGKGRADVAFIICRAHMVSRVCN